MKRKSSIKVIIFVILIAVVFLCNHYFHWSDYLGNMKNLSEIKEIVDNNFVFAFFLYTVVTIVGCVILALPGVTFALFAGMLFGPWIGILACLFATTAGASLAFLVSRFFLKDAVKPMLEKNQLLKKLLFTQDDKSTMLILMITRIIPIFPYNLQNFAYGVTDIGFWRYTVFTFIFMFPGVSFFTIGAAGITAEGNRQTYFFIAGILAILVTAVGLYLKERFLKEEKEDE